MDKYVCIATTDISNYTSESKLEIGNIYYVEHVTGMSKEDAKNSNTEIYYLFNENKESMCIIWRNLDDCLITIAEWREKQINSILNG